ncbi:hypothetical protein LZ198_33850 [Myxococcus sp. K15C18031901]|uniref:hypothetical protein n=1 Tax=Myxococcus dinghuensis TaxID=2906761 RepID=UPI0020A80472|nr:hypothetical protein [Myxococcus dinghuensis]MCP3103874.1 hypothetical protein [Myxococcus dinghuensis]
MLRKSLLCAAALTIAGCGKDAKNDEESFRQGLPSKEMVEMKSPQKGGQGLTSAYYGEHQLSENFALTAAAAVSVNGSTLWVLDLIQDIVRHPPSAIEGEVAVWGPYSGPLSLVTWKLTVTRTDDDTYSYALAGKGKSQDDSAYQTILSGSHTAAVDGDGERKPGYGSGDFLIDWDRNGTLPGNDTRDVGSLEVRYSRTGASTVATVEADFHQVRDDEAQGQRLDANYRYARTPGDGGELDFVIKKNIDLDPTLSQVEKLAIKSRWEHSGAGRSDIKLSGGDLHGEATLNECWDSSFLSVYYAASYNPFVGYGTVAACGGFDAAVYSTL